VTFQRKVTCVLILVITALIITIAGFVYPQAFRENLEGARYMLKGVAATGAFNIDGDLHQKIPPDTLAIHQPAYRELQNQLKQIQAANPGLRYVWTMAKGEKPGEMIFVGDVGGRNARPGLRYNASHIPDLVDGFKGPTADRSPVKGPWGTSLSGYAPIRNKAGETVAILGVDLYEQQLYRFRENFRDFLGICLEIGLGFAILMGGVVARWIARPLNRLVQGMHRVEEGELTQEVTLPTGDEFEEAAATFNRMTAGLVKARDELRTSFLHAIQSLMSALEAKDPYTRGHSVSVTRYATEIAKAMGKTDREIETLNRLAVLHDIGKIGIHDEVLTKATSLSEEERKAVEQHPVIGAKILAPLGLSPEELAIIISHHEREDGTGYPQRLDRSKISDLVAIVTVADSYDAMTSHRPYRSSLKPKEAIVELRRGAGTQFRPEVVEALARLLDQKGAL